MPHPNSPLQHCPLPLASICCGVALLETVLHWQITQRHNWFYASSRPSESRAVSARPQTSFHQLKRFQCGEGAKRIERARDRRASSDARATCGRVATRLAPSRRRARPAVTRENKGVWGSEVLCTRPAAIGLHLGHSMDRARRRGSMRTAGDFRHSLSFLLYRHRRNIEIFQKTILTIETKWCTNKFCLKKLLEGFDLLEYCDKEKKKECASVWLASSGTKDRAAIMEIQRSSSQRRKWNYVQDLLESIAWRKSLTMMESR